MIFVTSRLTHNYVFYNVRNGQLPEGVLYKEDMQHSNTTVKTSVSESLFKLTFEVLLD